MTTEAALISTVFNNPADATALLVYADWLQEQGVERRLDELMVRRRGVAVQNGATPDTVSTLAAFARTRAGRGQGAAKWRELAARSAEWCVWWVRLLACAIRAEVCGREGAPLHRNSYGSFVGEVRAGVVTVAIGMRLKWNAPAAGSDGAFAQAMMCARGYANPTLARGWHTEVTGPFDFREMFEFGVSLPGRASVPPQWPGFARSVGRETATGMSR